MAIKTMKPISQQGKKGNFHMFADLCKGCGLCIHKCPVNIIVWSEELGVYGTPAVKTSDQDKCIACKICEAVCPDTAIVIEKHETKKD